MNREFEAAKSRKVSSVFPSVDCDNDIIQNASRNLIFKQREVQEEQKITVFLSHKSIMIHKQRKKERIEYMGCSSSVLWFLIQLIKNIV